MNGNYSRDRQLFADAAADFAGDLAKHYGVDVIHANGSSSFFVGGSDRQTGALVGVNVMRGSVVVTVLMPGASLARFFYGPYCDLPNLSAACQFVDMVLGSVFAVVGDLAAKIAEHYGATARPSESDGSVWFVEDLASGCDHVCIVYEVEGRLDIIANKCANSSSNGFTLEVATRFIDSSYGVGGASGVIFEYVVPVSVCIRGGRVLWSNAERGGSLACITDALTGVELIDEEFDVTLSEFGDIADERARCEIGG